MQMIFWIFIWFLKRDLHDIIPKSILHILYPPWANRRSWCLETIWPFLADFFNFILPIGIFSAHVVPERGHACNFVMFLCTVHTNLNFIFLLFVNSVCVPNFLLPLFIFCPLVRGYIGKIDGWWGILRQNDSDFSFSLIRFSLSQKTREMNKPFLETIWPFFGWFFQFYPSDWNIARICCARTRACL